MTKVFFFIDFETSDKTTKMAEFSLYMTNFWEFDRPDMTTKMAEFLPYMTHFLGI